MASDDECTGQLGVVGVRVGTDTMTGGNDEHISTVQEEHDGPEYTALWYFIIVLADIVRFIN